MGGGGGVEASGQGQGTGLPVLPCAGGKYRRGSAGVCGAPRLRPDSALSPPRVIKSPPLAPPAPRLPPPPHPAPAQHMEVPPSSLLPPCSRPAPALQVRAIANVAFDPEQAKATVHSIVHSTVHSIVHYTPSICSRCSGRTRAGQGRLRSGCRRLRRHSALQWQLARAAAGQAGC